MLSWVMLLGDREQHPRPAWPGLPLSCIAQLHPTAPSWPRELIPSFSSGQLSFLVPSPSSLLGILAFSRQCGQAACMGNTYNPIPTHKPSTPLFPPSLPHPSWRAS